jgi:hypothetical protein
MTLVSETLLRSIVGPWFTPRRVAGFMVVTDAASGVTAAAAAPAVAVMASASEVSAASGIEDVEATENEARPAGAIPAAWLKDGFMQATWHTQAPAGSKNPIPVTKPSGMPTAASPRLYVSLCNLDSNVRGVLTSQGGARS